MGRSVGIDLGTTNSVLAILEGGAPSIVASAEGGRTTPSVVAFTAAGEVVVGEIAKRQAVTNPERTFRSAKRHMGTDWSTQQLDETWTAPQISAFVLGKLKRDAEQYLGEDVTDAVVTVPAYFTDAQRQATRDAGEIAGLNVQRIINEPTAAALAYGLASEVDEKILVFDLGGGTFDISLLEVEHDDGDGDVFTSVQVKATAGDNTLGGDDWDLALAHHLAATFEDATGVNVRDEPAAWMRLLVAAEETKVALSGMASTTVDLPYLAVTAEGPLHLSQTITRAEFQRVTQPLLERLRAPFHQVIADAQVSVSAIDHVVLVGGSTRMPAVADLVRDLTGGRAPHQGVNPDEVVAAGAALQAGVLAGEVKDVLLLDVTPLSLGIEVRGGRMSVLIERNTAVPLRRAQVYSTGVDNQDTVRVSVFQGERPLAADNQLLGNFALSGIPPAPKGVPKIEVAFEIDTDGIVHVSAKDSATGREQAMTVSGATSLSAEDIDAMVEASAKFAARDAEKTELVDATNAASEALYRLTQLTAAAEQTTPPTQTTDVNEAGRELETILASAAVTAREVRAATAAFESLLDALATQMYNAPGAPSTGSGGRHRAAEEVHWTPVDGLDVADEDAVTRDVADVAEAEDDQPATEDAGDASDTGPNAGQPSGT